MRILNFGVGFNSVYNFQTNNSLKEEEDNCFLFFLYLLTTTMNSKHIVASAFLAISALNGFAKDEVIMTVNGVDVPRSEFEYLYHKNQQQQVEPQSLEEYSEMFKIYKLKVADALSQHLDTLSTFRKEMDQYKADLAAPYMTDSVFLNALVKESFDRSRSEAEAIHIMIAKGSNFKQQKEAKNLADSIRTALLGGADFAALAKQYSVDRGSNEYGGRMGYILTDRFPYEFEKAAFSLKPGEISEIVESPQGYHILKGGNKRPARGSVFVEHIMKMTPPNATAQQLATTKALIDSIYNVAIAEPEKFEDLAREFSDDKRSAIQGGKLSWFGAGMMVEPFDSASFALRIDEISRPVKSQYGWHIIKKLDAKDPAPFNVVKAQVLKQIENPQNEKSLLVEKNLIERLAKKHKGALNKKNIDAICAEVLTIGIDSTWHAKALDPNGLGAIEIATIGKRSIPLSEWANTVRPMILPDGEEAASELRRYFEHHLETALKETEFDWLYANQPEYYNLLNEYREGSLLYEASVRRVWDKAAKDTDGLSEYFNAHRDNYTWQQPHVKGILVQATNDSVADVVREKLKDISDDNQLKSLKKEFAGKASIDKILMEEGQNPMVDNVIFGGAPVKPNNKKYTVYFIYDPKILNAPETMSDVKSLVTSDYQNQLESEWVEELKAKYPVNVNQKVLKKVK